MDVTNIWHHSAVETLVGYAILSFNCFIFIICPSVSAYVSLSIIQFTLLPSYFMQNNTWNVFETAESHLALAIQQARLVIMGLYLLLAHVVCVDSAIGDFAQLLGTTRCDYKSLNIELLEFKCSETCLFFIYLTFDSQAPKTMNNWRHQRKRQEPKARTSAWWSRVMWLSYSVVIRKQVMLVMMLSPYHNPDGNTIPPLVTLM